MASTLERFDAAAAGFRQRLALVTATDETRPSPCEGWTAKDVVEHTVGVVVMVTDLVGAPLAVEPAASDLARYDAAVADLHHKVADPVLGATVVDGPFGKMALKQLVSGIVVHDLLVHTWDLARATGTDERLDEELVTHTLASMTPYDDVLRAHGFAEGARRRRRRRTDRALVLPRATPLTEGGDYQPRSTHSSRCGRSTPIVVIAPCPGSTIVSSGYAGRWLADRAHDDREVPEVGLRVARPTREQRVAAEEQRRPLDREADGARRVPGRVHRADAQSPHLEGVVVLQEHVVALEHPGVDRRTPTS